jgi:hypothetical protein
VVSLTVFLANVISLDFLKLPGLAQFQLIRSITPIAYLGLALSPLFLSYKHKVLKILGFLAFLFLVLNLFYLFLITTIVFSVGVYLVREKKQIKLQKHNFLQTCLLITLIYISMNLQSLTNVQNKYQFPKNQNDWINVQIWAKENTPNDSIFLVPPDQTGFRIYSKRSIVGDIKDGAVAIYSSEYSKSWRDTMIKLNNHITWKENDLKILQGEYGFQYIVTLTDVNLTFQEIYRNKKFKIYKL